MVLLCGPPSTACARAGSDGEPRASVPGSALEDTVRSLQKAPVAGTRLIQEVQSEAGARLAPLITSGDGGGRALSLTLLDPAAEGKAGAAVRLVAYGDEDGDSRSSEDEAGAGVGRDDEEEDEEDGGHGEGGDGGEGGCLEGLVGFGSRAPGGSWDAAGGGGGGSSSSGGYGSSDDADPDFSLRFCTNCTAPLDGVVCLVRPAYARPACKYGCLTGALCCWNCQPGCGKDARACGACPSVRTAILGGKSCKRAAGCLRLSGTVDNMLHVDDRNAWGWLRSLPSIDLAGCQLKVSACGAGLRARPGRRRGAV